MTDLPDSMIDLEWKWLVSGQLLTGNKLKDNKWQRWAVFYRVKGAKLCSSVKIGSWLDIFAS